MLDYTFKDEIPSGGKRLYNIIDAATNAIIQQNCVLQRSNENEQEGTPISALVMQEIVNAINDMEKLLNDIPSNTIDLIHPVGSVITNSLASFDPNNVYEGTTWERIKGRVIVGVDEDDEDFAESGKTGGSKDIQKHMHAMGHTHPFSGTTESGGLHEHTTSGAAASSGAHTHTTSGTAASNGVHRHEHNLSKGNNFVTDSATGESVMMGWLGKWAHAIIGSRDSGAHTHTVSGTAASNGAHTHTTSGKAASAGSHTHTFSGATGQASNMGTGFFGEGYSGNLQPYITKYVWERTA